MLFLEWKPDASGFITIVYNQYYPGTGSTLGIYDSVGNLQKTLQIPTYYPASGAGCVAFLHQGADLIVSSATGTDIISLADGTTRLYSNWFLRAVDSAGNLALLTADDYLPQAYQPFSKLAIGDVNSTDSVHILRAWNEMLLAGTSMTWTTADRFSLIVFDSNNTRTAKEFDTTLKQHSSVILVESPSFNDYASHPTFFYSGVTSRYYLDAYPKLITIDPATGTRTTLDPNIMSGSVTMTRDGRYVIYSTYAVDQSTANQTHVINTKTGATGLFPTSNYPYALSPNGLHFAYTQATTSGVVVHVASVNLP